MALAAALVVMIPLLALGCQNREVPMKDQQNQTPARDGERLQPTEFDGERALDHVRKLVDMGPRSASSPGIKQAREYIVKELTSYDLKVREEKFIARTPNPKFPEVEMVNIIAEVPGEREGIIIIGSHYDTKWFPNLRFLGANDGGSSTGALLEMARVLAKTKPKYTLWLVFFDGEEAMNLEWAGDDHTYGSAHMANSLRDQGKIRDIKGLVLLDMIGDRNLVIRRDLNSVGWMNDIIWRTAARAGYSKNFINEAHSIEDDHVPFARLGVPAIDLIDFDYGPNNSYWHTEQDTIDKVSAQSLKAVGDTVIHALPELAEELGRRR